MNIVPESPNQFISKAEIEQVQIKEHEYFYLGTFLRTRGLKLYGYNSIKDELLEVQINRGSTLHLIPVDGKLVPYDPEMEKCTVDSRNEYFEALNYSTAQKRVNKYKAGIIPMLFNLRKPDPDGLKFF